MRILICDDNRDAAMTLGLLLGTERHDTFICHDGVSCVQKARDWRPHICLLDIGMPGMTGYSVARAIRDMDFGKDVLLVAITGYGSKEDARIAMEVGFDLHLVKPADAGRLLRLVSDRASGRPAA